MEPTVDMRLDPFLLPQVVRRWWHGNLQCLVALAPETRPFGRWYVGYVRIPLVSDLPSDYDRAPEDVREGWPWRELTFSGIPVDSSGLWYGFDLGQSFDFQMDDSGKFHYMRTEDDAFRAAEGLADAIAGHVSRSGGNPDDRRCLDCRMMHECYPDPDPWSWNWTVCERFDPETDESEIEARSFGEILWEIRSRFLDVEEV